jgi:hypothetical protein
METRTFFIDHKPSHSRVMVEFTLMNKRVVLYAVSFIKGNVLDINTVRACNKRAKEILLAG